MADVVGRRVADAQEVGDLVVPQSFRRDDGLGEVIVSEVLSFTTMTAEPYITEFDSIRTTRSLLSAALSAVVTDVDNNVVSVAWELVSGPAGATGTITPGGTLYAPTADFSDPSDPNGLYTIRLTVTDGDAQTAVREAQVQVYETACELAIVQGEEFNFFDADDDCDIDLLDFAAVAAEWADDINTDAQESVDAAWANYLPTSGGLVNGNFESTLPANGTGDVMLGWWGAGAVEQTGAGGEVFAGTYSAKLTGAGGMNSLNFPGVYPLPVGTHSIKFYYKGDSTELFIVLAPSMTSPTDEFDVPLVALGGGWVVETATVASYTQYEVKFTVVEAGDGSFHIGSSDAAGTVYFDNFELIIN